MEGILLLRPKEKRTIICLLLLLRREQSFCLVDTGLRCLYELGFKGRNILKLLMNCRYCLSQSVGINYRPSPTMENVYTCQSHATSLFIHYTSHKVSNSKTKLELAFQRLIDCILAQLNLLKGEALRLEQQTLKLREEDAMEFRLNSDLVGPYIVVAVDQELIFSTFVKRLKDRTEKNKILKQKKDTMHKLMQASSSQINNFQIKHREPFSLPLKLDKQLIQSNPKKKINPAIYESCLGDKQSWLQKKVLAKLSKNT